MVKLTQLPKDVKQVEKYKQRGSTLESPERVKSKKRSKTEDDVGLISRFAL